MVTGRRVLVSFFVRRFSRYSDIAVIIPAPTSQYEDALTLMVNHSITVPWLLSLQLKAPKIADCSTTQVLLASLQALLKKCSLIDSLHGLQLQQKNQSLLRRKRNLAVNSSGQTDNSCCAKNTLMGGVVPGSDMPLMTAPPD